MKQEKMWIHLNYFQSQTLFSLSSNHAAHLSFQCGAECTEPAHMQSGPHNENIYFSFPSWKEAPLENSASLIEMLLNSHMSINAGGEAWQGTRQRLAYISPSIWMSDWFPVKTCVCICVFCFYHKPNILALKESAPPRPLQGTRTPEVWWWNTPKPNPVSP